ncbi:MAG: DUF4388 domain-containing protein [Deltaproteobacteria bacterium]|nr:DUF4388 domain-containing protein [Deltaproteobacteria bacterium]MBW2071660.1 DUF4388 domain-containing protein [Deltaproteobacteria bacterium]
MALHGDAKTFSLGAIIRLIHGEKKNGVLTVVKDSNRSQIYFRDGKIVFVYYTGKRAEKIRLGELLKTHNLITDEQLDNALAVSRTMDKRMGTVLVERGYISRENLVQLLLEQFKDMVNKILNWDEAEFTYTDGLNGLEEDLRLELDPSRLVAEAEKWEHYRKIIPNDSVVFQIRPGALSSKSIYSGGALRVLLLIDGKRTVSQIIKETGHSKLAVYRAIANLFMLGAIVRKGAAGERESSVPLADSAIFSLYARVLQTIMDDLTEVLGTRAAAASFKKSLESCSYYSHFSSVRPEQGFAEAIEEIRSCFHEKMDTLSKTDLIKLFNQLVASLFKEEHRLLGSKAAGITGQKLRSFLDTVPANLQVLADPVRRFLDAYESESRVQGERKFTAAGGPRPVAAAPGAGTSAGLDKVDLKAVIPFYAQMFQVVMASLEQELGSKARDLFYGMAGQLRSGSNVFAAIHSDDGWETSLARLQELLKAGRLKLTTAELVGGLQQLLLGLLKQEKQLLGAKASRLTISRMRQAVEAAGSQRSQLHEHFAAFLSGSAGQFGG